MTYSTFALLVMHRTNLVLLFLNQTNPLMNAKLYQKHAILVINPTITTLNRCNFLTLYRNYYIT